VQAITDKDQRRSHRGRARTAAGRDQHVIADLERGCCAVRGHQFGMTGGLIHDLLLKRHRLQIAVDAGRLEPFRLQPSDDILSGTVISGRSGQPPFHLVVGQHRDIRPPLCHRIRGQRGAREHHQKTGESEARGHGYEHPGEVVMDRAMMKERRKGRRPDISADAL
jgi:hypothetical protein